MANAKEKIAIFENFIKDIMNCFNQKRSIEQDTNLSLEEKDKKIQNIRPDLYKRVLDYIIQLNKIMKVQFKLENVHTKINFTKLYTFYNVYTDYLKLSVPSLKNNKGFQDDCVLLKGIYDAEELLKSIQTQFNSLKIDLPAFAFAYDNFIKDKTKPNLAKLNQQIKKLNKSISDFETATRNKDLSFISKLPDTSYIDFKNFVNDVITTKNFLDSINNILNCCKENIKSLKNMPHKDDIYTNGTLRYKVCSRGSSASLLRFFKLSETQNKLSSDKSFKETSLQDIYASTKEVKKVKSAKMKREIFTQIGLAKSEIRSALSENRLASALPVWRTFWYLAYDHDVFRKKENLARGYLGHRYNSCIATFFAADTRQPKP